MFSPFCDAKNQKLNISEILLIKLDIRKILLNQKYFLNFW